MPVVTERRVWRRQSDRKRSRTIKEEEVANVRRALQTLRVRYGSWRKLAALFGVNPKSIRNFTGAHSVPPTFRLALPAARLAGVPVESIVSGQWPPPGYCPLCGHVQLLT